MISQKIEAKLLEKHQVVPSEVEECFQNLTGSFLKDVREKHQTDPATLWFLAMTNRNRLLKVCFVPRGAEQFIRSAYPPNDDEIRIFKSLGKPTDF